MNPNNLKKNDAMVIINRGQLFCPAYLHYGKNPLNVRCCYCGIDNLACCVGFDTYDLCMDCVNTITKSLQPQQNFIKQINQDNRKQIQQVQTDNLNIRPVNDFDLGNVGGGWTDLFDSSLNLSGTSYKTKPYNGPSPNFFTQTRQDDNQFKTSFGCSISNPRLNPTPKNNNSSNNQSINQNYLETFYQPLNPNGFSKGG